VIRPILTSANAGRQAGVAARGKNR